MPENTLYRKPEFTRHRKVEGAPVTTDPANLDTLFAGAGGAPPNVDPGKGKAAINAQGYDTLWGFVKLTGGSSITLDPVEAVRFEGDAGEQETFINHPDGPIGPLSDGDSFKLPIDGGGKWFFRIAGVVGAVTKAEVYLAAGSRAEEGSI